MLNDIGTFGPSAYGAYDMGNQVAEWVINPSWFSSHYCALMIGKAGDTKKQDWKLYAYIEPGASPSSSLRWEFPGVYSGPNTGFRTVAFNGGIINGKEFPIADATDMVRVEDGFSQSGFDPKTVGGLDLSIIGGTYGYVTNQPDVRYDTGISPYENLAYPPSVALIEKPLVGTVTYNYYISKYQVTNEQYAEFLNYNAKKEEVAEFGRPYNFYNFYNSKMTSSDLGGIVREGSDGSYTYRAKSGMEHKPVNYVNYIQASQYCYWVNQGRGTIDIGSFPNNSNVLTANNLDSSNCRLATFDEWYKAAYYKGGNFNAGYWNYGNESDLGMHQDHPFNGLEVPQEELESKIRIFNNKKRNAKIYGQDSLNSSYSYLISTAESSLSVFETLPSGDPILRYNDDGSGGPLMMKAKQRIKNAFNRELPAAAKKIEDETRVTKNIKVKVETNVRSNLDEPTGES